MNRTKIEWTDYSWNPITGCSHGCWYCYAKKLFTRFHRSFEPTFHPERISEPRHLTKSSKIFVCSVADLFAPWTPVEWMTAVMYAIVTCPVKHTFQLLTKNPERIPLVYPYKFPDNCWVGTTVTTENGDERNIDAIKKVDAKVKFVSFEPLLGRLSVPSPVEPDKQMFELKGLQWIIIGKLTGSRRVKLDPEWIDDILLDTTIHDIPVFMKNNLFTDPHTFPLDEYGTRRKRQEFPKEDSS